MPDLTPTMNEGSDDGFHEIQLSGKQLVFLFMATTVVSVVIFLCGVLVGRGVRTERALPEDVVEPTAATQPAAPDTTADAGASAVEPPNPPAEGDAPLKYKERLESDKPLPETLRPAADTPKTANEPKLQAEQPRAAPEPPKAQAEPPKASEQQKQKAEQLKAAAPVVPPARPARTGSSRDSWVVQIVALRDRQTANSIVKRLTGKGYPAFLVDPAAGAPAPVFRVQVGRYADRDEAEQVRRRLEKEEQFKPWISR